MHDKPDPEVEMLRLGMIHDQIAQLREELNRLKQHESNVNSSPPQETESETKQDPGNSTNAEITE